MQALFLGQPDRAAAKQFVDLAQTLDRRRNRLPVRQHAAEPARVDVILRRPFRGVGDRVLGLPLGADEQHAAALRDRIGNGLQRLMQQRHRLGEVDDMDIVAGAEDERRHFRVPAVRLVAEMSPRFEQAAHREFRQSHDRFSG